MIKFNVKKSIITALFIALCVVLPVTFHAIPNAGNVLCPIHIPVLLCGFVCGGGFGLLCGVVGCILSSVITGMPPAAILPCMVAELAVYGFVTGLMMKAVRTKNIYADIYISLVSALISGKIAGGVLKGLLFSAEGYTVAVWAVSYFVTALPGIIIQLVLIPTIIVALQKAGLVPSRY